MAAEEEGGPVVQPPAAVEGFKPVVASRAFWEGLNKRDLGRSLFLIGI